MRGILLGVALPVVAAMALGCAASAGGGSGATTYRKDLGNVTPYDFSRHTQRILGRYHFEFEQMDSTENYQLFKTRWLQRYPLDDEITMGVVEIQTQLTLRARTRGGGAAGTADLRSAEMIAQNMARLRDSNQWILTVFSPEFKEYIDEIAQELKTEFTSGIRVFR